MVSTTGEHIAYFELDEDLKPREKEVARWRCENRWRASKKIVSPRCARFCSWAAREDRCGPGVTENPVKLTHSVRDALTRVTCGGAPVYVWPGGGITFMADVSRMPQNAFGYVPTPALVAPIEFTLRWRIMRRSAAMWKHPAAEFDRC